MIELELGRAYRLLVMCDGSNLVLADVGDHGVVRRFKRSRATTAEARVEAPEAFRPGFQSRIFATKEQRGDESLGRQVNEDWFYKLDEPQDDAVSQVLEQNDNIFKHATGYGSTLALGGPGTGKTIVILNLLKLLTDAGFAVGLSMKPQVRAYLSAATGMKPDRFAVSEFGRASCDVLLVDDPTDIQAINEAISVAKSHRTRQVVIAFDPLQLIDDLDDDKLDKLRLDNKSRSIVLSTCYRQRAAIGERTKEIVTAISDSTPFLASSKKEAWWNSHSKVNSYANSWRMSNPGGRTAVHDPSSGSDVVRECHNLSTAGALWNHWAPVAMFIDEEAGTSASLADIAESELRRQGIAYERVRLSEVERVKGLEFQHAFIFLSAQNYDQIENGFTGSGQRVYHTRRRLRIPFSRPKDGLVTFVCS